MGRKLTISNENSEIIFFELDGENEMEIILHETFQDDSYKIWLSKKNINSLYEHITHVKAKFNF